MFTLSWNPILYTNMQLTMFYHYLIPLLIQINNVLLLQLAQFWLFYSKGLFFFFCCCCYYYYYYYYYQGMNLALLKIVKQCLTPPLYDIGITGICFRIFNLYVTFHFIEYFLIIMDTLYAFCIYNVTKLHFHHRQTRARLKLFLPNGISAWYN